MNFSFDTYKKMIFYLKEQNYTFSSFENYSKLKRIYLRHNIDIYSDNALNLALIEKECEVSAIYFFQLDSTFYNILSDEVLTTIKEINNLGHEIGLHINPHKVKSPDELMDKITKEYNFFKNYFPLSKIISFHRPPEFIFKNLEFDGFINVYGDKYFKDIRYLSDSKRRNLYPNLLESLKTDNKTSIQLLTHPYWWDHISLNVYDAFDRFVETQKNKYRRKLQEEIKPYTDYFDYRF